MNVNSEVQEMLSSVFRKGNPKERMKRMLAYIDSQNGGKGQVVDSGVDENGAPYVDIKFKPKPAVDRIKVNLASISGGAPGSAYEGISGEPTPVSLAPADPTEILEGGGLQRNQPPSDEEKYEKTEEEKKAEEDARIEKEASQEAEPSLIDLRNELLDMQTEMARMDYLLSLYEAMADTQLPQMQQNAELTIKDGPSAYKATVEYNREWFSKRLMSLEAKRAFAATLLNACLRYTQDNTETLSLIANGDPDMLDSISMPIPDDDSDE